MAKIKIRPTIRIEEATTPSLEALKAFSLGQAQRDADRDIPLKEANGCVIKGFLDALLESGWPLACISCASAAGGVNVWSHRLAEDGDSAGPRGIGEIYEDRLGS